MSNELEIKLARLEEKQILESASLRENMSEVKTSLALINTKLDNIAVAENSKLLTNQELKMTIVEQGKVVASQNARITVLEGLVQELRGFGWKILAGGGLAGLGGAGVIDLIAKALTG